MPWPPTTPIISREPVPALPKSSASAGLRAPPMPTPRMRQSPSPRRSITAPSARQAAAVRSTSSPSSRPLTVVSPHAQQAEDQRAMRDRFVARQPHPAFAGGRPAGGEGPRRAVMGAGHGQSPISPARPPDGARDSTGAPAVTRGAAWPRAWHGIAAVFLARWRSSLRRIRRLSELAFDSRHAHD